MSVGSSAHGWAPGLLIGRTATRVRCTKLGAVVGCSRSEPKPHHDGMAGQLPVDQSYNPM
jgi:hypothetical protein